MNANAEKYPGKKNRATLEKAASIKGIGLHSGEKTEVIIHPANPLSGLSFLKSGETIPVHPDQVSDTLNAVTLGKGNTKIQTVEHLLAALATAGITDAVIEIAGSEIPIVDGSALPFYEAIVDAGIFVSDIPLAPIHIETASYVLEPDKYLIALPHDSFRITYSIDYDHPLLRGQSITVDINSDFLAKEILPARTFGFLKDVEYLKSKGLIKGGSLDNALVLTPEGFVNDSLRFDNECLRHKILDLVGDLYLIGRPICGHIIAFRAGHALDAALASKIMRTSASFAAQNPGNVEKKQTVTQ